MKKILGLLLACMLVLSMTAALAEPIDKLMFNLQGYAVGLNAEDTRIKWNGKGVSGFEYITPENADDEKVPGKGYFGLVEPEKIGSGLLATVTGPLKEDVPYRLQIIIPLDEDDVDPSMGTMDISDEFDMVNSYVSGLKIGMITRVSDEEGTNVSWAAIFIVGLNPAPKDLPDSGDGVELMMWSAMVAFAAVGLITLSRKARREY